MLRDVWLRDFAVRYMGPSVGQAGDPIPTSLKAIADDVAKAPGERCFSVLDPRSP
jgi:hypothetical protein